MSNTTAQADLINYKEIVGRFPWITERDRNCILSPDSDGFLCGLAMSHYLNWNIVGFYDGKIMLLQDGIDYRDCTFLDMEINRPGVSSMGNHLVEYSYRIELPERNFDQCIQPNILRGFDGRTAFQRKYPFGTIHLLLSILGGADIVRDLPDSAISPLLFADGVGNNLFGYPENCLDWLRYMRVDQPTHILHRFLCESDFNFYTAMQYLERFYEMRDRYNANGYYNGDSFVPGGRNMRTGHNVRITNSKGEPINLVKNGDGNLSLHENEINRVRGFIREIAEMMGWHYQEEKWTWSNYRATIFRKGMLSSDNSNNSPNLNNRTYTELLERNPFSLAMTASNRVEYTTE